MKKGKRGHSLEIDEPVYSELRRWAFKHRIIMNRWVSDLISASLAYEIAKEAQK